MIYEPKEDSFLIEKYVKRLAKGKVLDMGTGSGILAEAAKKNGCDVLAVDINKEAVEFCRKKGINARVSNLFENINEKFDLIIFNPPYLPLERDYCGIKFTEKDFNYVNDVEIVGGKKGYETIERFFSQARKYLKENGRILILFSSLTDKKKVEEIIEKNGFKFELLEEKKIFFESLYVYLVY